MSPQLLVRLHSLESTTAFLKSYVSAECGVPSNMLNHLELELWGSVLTLLDHSLTGLECRLVHE